MKEADGQAASFSAREVRRTSAYANEPAIQVICLGSGGGPSEDNVTGFLVRSTATNWAKNSVLAVDAGSHLAAITRILERDFPLVSEPHKPVLKSRDGNGVGDSRGADSPSPRVAHLPLSDEESDVSSPTSEHELEHYITTLREGVFSGLPFPHASARANALHLVREHISTYLITHPHLDHVSGFVINTAAFHNTSRPKRLAALPFTVKAIKTHIFNNIIWPNLTDEDGGVGLVSFQRLAEGGNIALGQGSGRGYIEVCDGLGVKGFKVSHGHCMGGHIHHGSNANFAETQASNVDYREGRSTSFSLPVPSAPGTPALEGRLPSAVNVPVADHCVIDSSAYFIRTESTSTTPTREILMFGDVEPDSLSLSPRSGLIWTEAAPKIAAGILTGIFIECSYTNAQADAVLFGHLSPRHLLAELQNLAEKVQTVRRGMEEKKGRKRKRANHGLSIEGNTPAGRRTRSKAVDTPVSDAHMVYPFPCTDDELMTDASRNGTGANTPSITYNDLPSSLPTLNFSAMASAGEVPSTTVAQGELDQNQELSTTLLDTAANRSLPTAVSAALAPIKLPLKGLKVVVIHVKDTCSDGPLVGETILRELVEGEERLGDEGRGLGCVFEIAGSGKGYWF